MSENPDTIITELLEKVAAGDSRASAELLPIVYDELRKLARSWMAAAPSGQTLQPTALVHEAYLRLVATPGSDWHNRRHFFFAAARAMRDILIEQARRKATLKRGGGRKRVNPENLVLAIESPAHDMLALDEALEELKVEDARKHEIVMLRFFAGLTMRETAQAMDLPLRTLEREWRYIRARLHKLLCDSESPG